MDAAPYFFRPLRLLGYWSLLLVIFIWLFLVHIVQLAVDIPFKGLDGIEPVRRNGTYFVAMGGIALFRIGNDQHLQIRFVEEPGK